MAPESVEVLGVPVDGVTESEVLAFVAERVKSREPAQIATVNAEFVMHAQRIPEFRRVLRSADLRTADGFGVVLAARRRGLRLKQRVGGSDLIWSISEQAARMGHRIFLLGAAEGVAEAAAVKLQSRFPGLIIAGTYAGEPYGVGAPELSRAVPDSARRHETEAEGEAEQRSTLAEEEQLDLIRESKPDIMFVAFGAPRQDLWIARVKNDLDVPVIMGVGGSFDYVAGVAKRAPKWMQTYGMDWLFRLVTQPWRWRRMSVLPAFAALAFLRND